MICLVNCLTSHASAYPADHSYISIRSLRSSAVRRQSKPKATTSKRNKYELCKAAGEGFDKQMLTSLFHTHIVVQSSAFHVLQFGVTKKMLERSRTVIDRMKYPCCSESLFSIYRYKDAVGTISVSVTIDGETELL